MKYLPTFEEFKSESSNKIYFIMAGSIIDALTSPGAHPLNKKMDNFIIDNFFEQLFSLKYKSKNDIIKFVKELPSGSTIYSFKPLGVHKKIYTDMRPLVKILYDELYKRKDLNVYMNTNLSASKVETQKLFNDKEFFPSAVYKKEDVKKIGFPIVCKPDFGHSGLGIEKFNNQKEMDKYYKDNDNPKFDLFCEYVDYDREFRALFIEKDLFYIGERIPKEEKNINIDNKDADEKMAFVYVAQDLNKFQYKNELLKINKIIFEKLHEKVYSIDFFLTKDKKIKVIEINSQTGLDPYRLALLYENLYKKSYGKELPKDKKKLLSDVVNVFLNNEYNEYKKEIKQSLEPVNYSNITISDEVLSKINKYSDKKFNVT